MRPEYSPHSRAERLIATGRVILAAFSLLAIWLDRAAPMRHVQIFYPLLVLYLLYALLLAVVEVSLPAPLLRLRVLTQAFDLGVFTLFMFFGEGPTSPFFVYFVFSVACATLRWQWRGTAWTAVIALATFIGLGIYAGVVLRDPAFEINRFIIRSVYLTVVAAMLGYMGAYEERVRGEMAKLAAWPRTVPGEGHALAREVLEHAAGVLGAPRVLLVWDEPEEPWRHLASWSTGRFDATREPPTTFEPIVAEALAGTSFLCLDAGAPVPIVLHTSSAGLRRWSGRPVHADLGVRFAVRALLSLSLRGETAEGRLFAFDKADMTSDDLVLGEIVARQVAARMDHFYLSQRLQAAAASEERIRLARDLHDGVVQSLTGAALQLETVRSLVDAAPRDARERLLEVQDLILAEQRELRAFIDHLRPGSLGAAEPASTLAARLDAMRGRIERQWGLRVEMRTEPLDERVSGQLAQQVYRLVHEAVVNAARHARASAVLVGLSVQADQLRIIVADDGRGFAFRGRYDLEALATRNVGPVSLRERVSLLGGSLVIESTESGARVKIAMPLSRRGA